MSNVRTIAVAIYATIVATGALFLKIRRWVESGPRLHLTVSRYVRNSPSIDHRVPSHRGRVATRLANQETKMTCIHCHGQMKRSKAPFHVDRNGYHLVLDTVPAWVCDQCGEAYFEERKSTKFRVPSRGRTTGLAGCCSHSRRLDSSIHSPLSPTSRGFPETDGNFRRWTGTQKERLAERMCASSSSARSVSPDARRGAAPSLSLVGHRKTSCVKPC